MPSAELVQLGLLFRLQRHGILTPRPLAFGQKRRWPWQIDSFLLTESPANARPLADVAPSVRLDRAASRRLLAEVALLLHRLHQAGCTCDGSRLVQQLVVHPGGEVGLGGLEGIVRTKRQPTSSRVSSDLLAFWKALPADLCRPTDAIQFLRAYRSAPLPDAAAAQLATQLMVSRRAA
jgi:hypothetical protein